MIVERLEWKSLILWTGALYKHHELGPKKEVNVELPKKCYSPYISVKMAIFTAYLFIAVLSSVDHCIN